MAKNLNLPIQADKLKLYRDYQYGRSDVYRRKNVLGQPKPWTDDYYLKNFKFTNVHRKNDRESQFLLRTVCENPDLSLEDKAMNCALFRCINNEAGCSWLPEWPIRMAHATSADIDWEGLKADEDKLKANAKAETRQSNAYFLSMVVLEAYKNAPELRGYTLARFKMVLDNKDKILAALKAESAEEAVETLKTVKGFGEFIAYQIWEDWTYCPEYKFTDNDYVNCGPGAIQGIDWLIGNCEIYTDEIGKKRVKYNLNRWSQQDYNDWIRNFTTNIQSIMSANGLEFKPEEILDYMKEPHDRIWSLGTCQNSFCEFNKLNKLMNGVAMRIRKYEG